MTVGTASSSRSSPSALSACTRTDASVSRAAGDRHPRTAEDVARVEGKLREINKFAEILQCTKATVSMDKVLGIKAFDLDRVLEVDPGFLSEGSEHTHDESVFSVGFEVEGDLVMEKTNTWIAKLLQEKGVDIFRMKGVLAMEGCEERYVYQGVHMLFTGETLTPWGADKHVNRLIFIGRNLNRAELEEGFRKCLAGAAP